MTDTNSAFWYSCVMGGVIFFCRALPFLFFKHNNGTAANNTFASRFKTKLLLFIERTAPPAAMSILAFNALALSLKNIVQEHGITFEAFIGALPVLSACALCAALHFWKRNPLLSIFSATALYMLLIRVL